MSYEGFEQHICENGHLFFNHDIYNDDTTCSCGAKSAWRNQVNDTNCEQAGYIPHEFLKLFQWGVFAIPSPEETESIRTCKHPLKGLIFLEDYDKDPEEMREVLFPEYKICEYNMSTCILSHLNCREYMCKQPQNNFCL